MHWSQELIKACSLEELSLFSSFSICCRMPFYVYSIRKMFSTHKLRVSFETLKEIAKSAGSFLKRIARAKNTSFPKTTYLKTFSQSFVKY